jgi:hypothetical protein
VIELEVVDRLPRLSVDDEVEFFILSNLFHGLHEHTQDRSFEALLVAPELFFELVDVALNLIAHLGEIGLPLQERLVREHEAIVFEILFALLVAVLSHVSSIVAGLEVYGTCLYVSPVTGSFFVFVDSRAGLVEQWELVDDGTGSIDGTLVRSFAVGSEAEGCVADDETAQLYIAEEAVGIWKYGAEPGAGATRSLVDGTAPNGHLTADVEGLTLYHASDGLGYLIASSQGSSTYVLYERGGAMHTSGSSRSWTGMESTGPRTPTAST